MSRIIRIENCNQCPHKDLLSWKDDHPFIPVCLASGSKILPTEDIYASLPKCLGIIPEWCPLEHDE